MSLAGNRDMAITDGRARNTAEHLMNVSHARRSSDSELESGHDGCTYTYIPVARGSFSSLHPYFLFILPYPVLAHTYVFVYLSYVPVSVRSLRVLLDVH